MARNTPKMALSSWNTPLDPYSYEQLDQNWEKIDFHDHTPGRGVQIPAGGIAPGAIGISEIASGVPLVPTGAVLLWTLSTIPSGFLLCDGSYYAITLYGPLYNVIGTVYDNSPPSGYFNVPLITLGPPTYGQTCWIIRT